jgi:hypothetical protein
MTLDRRMRQAAESVRRYADHEVDPVAMLWRLRAHQRRRSLQAAAVALALVAGLVAAAVLVARAPQKQPPVTRPPRSLGRVVATIPLPQAAFPRAIGVADGSVWVDGGNATALRIDPRTNQVLSTVRLPAGSRLAAVAAGGLWLVNEAAGTVSQADSSGQVRRTVNVGWRYTATSPDEEGFTLAVDGDSVWVAVALTGVAHLDWARGTVTARFTDPLGVGRYDVIAAGRGVALTEREQDTEQLDPRTGKATTIKVGRPHALDAVAFGAGSFWASVSDTLVRIDPTRRRVVATIGLAGYVAGPLVVGEGAVWVWGGGRLLRRVDPASKRVVHTLADLGPYLGLDYARLAVGAGAVWLSDAQHRTLIRIDPNG